ncbi:MAG: MFS transporter [Planctomycetes bacterium]|nr:MFS transporter [Planctomycetota bacterium]
MLFRFSLYGFLKNLRFYDAFLLLALRDRGLDFLAIGWLVAVREITTVVLEVPSGALADTIGRKRCVVASMLAYVASGLLLAFCDGWWWLAVAMALYGFGDAFRSGTHKAMIRAWLRQHDRVDEQTRVYGFTRSWSKLGSACSALLGGTLLVVGADYRALFVWGAVTSGLNACNLATYPSSLDGRVERSGRPLRESRDRIVAVGRRLARPGALRPLLVASMAMQGGYAVLKDYLQPVLQTIAISLPIAVGMREDARVGVVVGVVSASLFVLASAASRRAHSLESWYGDRSRCVRGLLWASLGLYVLVAACLWLEFAIVAAAIFVAIAVLQNLWRPVQVGLVGDECADDETATVLSVESQAKSLTSAAMAPVVGAAIDALTHRAASDGVSPLAAVGLLALPLLVAIVVNRRGYGSVARTR